MPTTKHHGIISYIGQTYRIATCQECGEQWETTSGLWARQWLKGHLTSAHGAGRVFIDREDL